MGFMFPFKIPEDPKTICWAEERNLYGIIIDLARNPEYIERLNTVESARETAKRIILDNNAAVSVTFTARDGDDIIAIDVNGEGKITYGWNFSKGETIPVEG